MAVSCLDGKLENLEMRCIKPIELELSFVAKSCWNNSEDTLWFHLGLDLPEGKQFTMIEGCYNRAEERSLFTIHRLDGDFLHSNGPYNDEMPRRVYEARVSLSKYFSYFLNELKRENVVSQPSTSNKFIIYKKKQNFSVNVINPKRYRTLTENYDELFNFHLFDYSKKHAFNGGPTTNLSANLMDDFMAIYERRNMTIESRSSHPLPDCNFNKFTFTARNSECVSSGKDFSAFLTPKSKDGERSIVDNIKNAITNLPNSIKMIRNIIASTYPTNGEKFVHHTLAPFSDFSLPLQQYGALHYINNVPITTSLLDSQWTALEEKIRAYAISTRAKHTIVTGVHDILPVSEGGEFLGVRDKIPVPKYVWKMVIDVKKNDGVVFVLFNSEKWDKVDLCKNVCKIKRRSNIICCTVADFLGKVPNAPQIEVDGSLEVTENILL